MKPAAAPEARPPAPPPTDAVRARARRRWRHRVGRLLWSLFLWLDVPLLLAVAGGLAAAYLHPRPFWWLQLLGITLPYLTWVLGVAALVPLVGRRWVWFGLHLVFLAAVAWRAYPLERFVGPPPARDDDLTVMTFNVPQSGPSGEALSDSLVALVAREQPDVLALQEVWASVGARPLRNAVHAAAVVERLPYALVRPPRPPRSDPRPVRNTVVPVLVRDDAVTVLERQIVPLGAEGDERTSSATRTRFRWQGREGVLYNVHLRSFGDEKPWEDRIRLLEPTTWLPYLRRYRDVFRARADDVEQLAEAVEAEALPVLIVGDLNGTADNWTYWRLRGDRQDAFLSAGVGAGNTYRADKPFVRIDFALVDPAWEVTAADVADVAFSDHRPLVVGLRWAEEEGGALP